MKKITQLFFAMLFLNIGLASATNLIANWGGNGATGTGSEPNNFGWEYTDGSMAWGIVNAGGNRYRDGLSKSHEDGKDMTGHRQFMVRWDIGGSSATDYYNYPVTLEAGKSYEFYWDYAWGNSGSSPSMTLSIGQAKDGSDAIASKVFATSSTKELYRSGTMAFNCEVSGQYYLKIMSDYNAWFAATNMSITQTAGDVTDWYLTNANFEQAPTGMADANTIYDVLGWTEVPFPAVGYQKLGTMIYGTTGDIGDTPPNTSSVTTDTVVLGIKEHWNSSTTDKLYVEQTAKLAGGTYSLEWDSYVKQTLSSQDSRCGYVIDGVGHYAPIASGLDAWESQSLSIDIADSTDVTFRFGYYKNANVGGTSSPILFIDNVKIIKVVDPILEVSETYMVFDEIANTATFVVNGANLSEDITITSPNSDFSVDITTVGQDAGETTITATFDGLVEAKDYITITSSGATKKVRVLGFINDAPYYPTGNLISNFNLNSLDDFSGWGGGKSITTDTAMVYSGKSCLKMTGACGASVDYSLTSVLESNTAYKLRAMVYGINYTFYLSQWNIDGSDKVLFTTTENNWVQFEEVVMTGDLTGKTPAIYFNSCENTRGSLAYLDNYELYKMPMYLTESSLEFLEGGNKTVAVTAQTLTEAISITAPAEFSVDSTSLSSTADSAVVTVTFTGNASSSGYIVFTSGIYTDSVFVEGIADPTLIVSETYLTFDDEATTATFMVTGGNLTEDIAITAPSGFSVDNATVGQTAGETTITATFDGLVDAKDYIMIASSGLTEKVRVIGTINDTPLYPTGNLISNFNLNTLDGFSGWGSGNRTVSTDTAIVYSGKGCMKSVGDCGNSADYALGSALESDTYYRYRTMLNSTGTYRIAFKNAYINDEKEGNHDVPDTEGVWSPFNFIFKTGTVEPDQYIFFNSCGDKTGTLAYLDNVELYKMPIHIAADSLFLDGISDSVISVAAQLADTDVAFSINAPAGITLSAASIAADGFLDLTVSFDNSNNTEGYVTFDNGTYSDSIYVVATKNVPTAITANTIAKDKVFVSNGKVNVKIALEQASQVTYNVYNLQGGLVATQLSHYTTGTHSTTLDAQLANGIYLVNIIKGGQSQTYKLVK